MKGYWGLGGPSPFVAKILLPCILKGKVLTKKRLIHRNCKCETEHGQTKGWWKCTTWV